MGASYTLRVANASDTEFLWRVQRDTLGEYVTACFGTDTHQQREFFDEHFDTLRHQVIQVAGQDAGFLRFEEREGHIYLANLALLPQYQRRGIGSAITRRVLSLGAEINVPVRLQVLQANPAVHFYERLGFRRCGETATHFLYELGND